jgi:hypothetical protein
MNTEKTSLHQLLKSLGFSDCISPSHEQTGRLTYFTCFKSNGSRLIVVYELLNLYDLTGTAILHGCAKQVKSRFGSYSFARNGHPIGGFFTCAERLPVSVEKITIS